MTLRRQLVDPVTVSSLLGDRFKPRLPGVSPNVEEDVSVLGDELLFALDRQDAVIVKDIPLVVEWVEAVGDVVTAVHVAMVITHCVQVVHVTGGGSDRRRRVSIGRHDFSVVRGVHGRGYDRRGFLWLLVFLEDEELAGFLLEVDALCVGRERGDGLCPCYHFSGTVLIG